MNNEGAYPAILMHRLVRAFGVRIWHKVFHITDSYVPGQGRIRDFWKGGHIYKIEGVRFADFISFLLNIP